MGYLKASQLAFLLFCSLYSGVLSFCCRIYLQYLPLQDLFAGRGGLFFPWTSAWIAPAPCNCFLCLCSMRSTPANFRWITKARQWRGWSSPWSMVSTLSPRKQSWRKERGKQLQVLAWEPVNQDSEQSAAWVLHGVMMLKVQCCGLHLGAVPEGSSF